MLLYVIETYIYIKYDGTKIYNPKIIWAYLTTLSTVKIIGPQRPMVG